MSLVPVFNKTSPHAHTESKLDMLVVYKKLMKYLVHLSKRKKLNFFYFSSHKLPKQQLTNFWSQGILGVKCYIINHNNTFNFEIKKTNAIKAEIYKIYSSKFLYYFKIINLDQCNKSHFNN
jgi:hypothetical protein